MYRISSAFGLIAKHFVSNFFALPFIILIAAIFYPSPISFFILKILLLCSAKLSKKRFQIFFFDFLSYTLPAHVKLYSTKLIILFQFICYHYYLCHLYYSMYLYSYSMCSFWIFFFLFCWIKKGVNRNKCIQKSLLSEKYHFFPFEIKNSLEDDMMKMAALLICIFYEPYRTRTTSINELLFSAKETGDLARVLTIFFRLNYYVSTYVGNLLQPLPKKFLPFPNTIVAGFFPWAKSSSNFWEHPDIYYKSYYY